MRFLDRKNAAGAPERQCKTCSTGDVERAPCGSARAGICSLPRPRFSHMRGVVFLCFDLEKRGMVDHVPSAKAPIVAAGILAAALSLSPGAGQERATATPDFSGLWGRDSLHLEQPMSGPGPVVNMMHSAAGTMDMNALVGDYTNPILKPEAAAILKQRGEASLKGISVPNPHDQCRPEPPPFIFAVQFAMKMLQQKDQVTIVYSHDNKVHRIRLNQPHPARVVPSWQGDSVGHYEGDALVIDTVAIKVSPLSALDW